MTPAALRAQLGRLGLTQTAAARLLGVDPRTMRRWIAGERDISPPAAFLLALLEAEPRIRALLAEMADRVARGYAPRETPPTAHL